MLPRRPKTSTFIPPLKLGEQEKPPTGPGWIHEIKWDGYRVQVHLAGGQATVYTRRGHDWTRQFRPIADALARLPAERAVIDGEAVVLSDTGVADFHELRRDLDGRSRRLRLQAFDLLALDGGDLRSLPLLERKARLEKLLTGASAALVYVEHLTGSGARILSQARRMGIEGIVSKRADSPYRSGRSKAWIRPSASAATRSWWSASTSRRPSASTACIWLCGVGRVYAGSVEIGH